MTAERGTGRIDYLDWLRVAAVGGVFLFHTLRPFDDGDWHVKNFFVIGHLVLSDERLVAAVLRDAVPGLVLGLGAFGVGVATALLPAAFLISAALAWILSVLPGVSVLFGVKRQQH